MTRIRFATSVTLLLLVATRGASFGQCTALAPTNPCVPGGGSGRDCPLELIVTPQPSLRLDGTPMRQVTCREGDPRCDADAVPGNDRCMVRIALCANNNDPRIASRCTPSGILQIEVKQPMPQKLRDAADSANLTALENLAGAGGLGVTVVRSRPYTVFPGTPNTTFDQCTTTADLEVPLGRRTVAIRTTTLDGRTDTDTLRFDCLSSTCGDGFVQPYETCDDGNRLNGDGCDQACRLEATPTPTATPIVLPSDTPTTSPTDTPVPTDTPTVPPTDTPLPTDTPAVAPTDTPPPPDTPTALPTDTQAPTDTPTPPPTDTPLPPDTPTATPT